MPIFRTGIVVEIASARRGLQRINVQIDAAVESAYVLTDLVGDVRVGDEVICNTSAVALGLGTGGSHVVHWNLSRTELNTHDDGHIVKMRYTSLQKAFETAEERDVASELSARPLEGLVVVVCTVHSQFGIVATVARHLRRDWRISYVMTDGAALPLAVSDLVATLCAQKIVNQTLTTGHAFGGDEEAVTLASGLIAAQRGGADLAIVCMGPGVVGTGSTYGTTAIEAASILDTVAALGGTAILCPRASAADGRDRHHGLSHHTATVLTLAHTRPHMIEVSGADPELLAQSVQHGVPQVDTRAALVTAGVAITTMGRTIEQDPLFFDACGRTAALAVELSEAITSTPG